MHENVIGERVLAINQIMLHIRWNLKTSEHLLICGSRHRLHGDAHSVGPTHKSKINRNTQLQTWDGFCSDHAEFNRLPTSGQKCFIQNTKLEYSYRDHFERLL